MSSLEAELAPHGTGGHIAAAMEFAGEFAGLSVKVVARPGDVAADWKALQSTAQTPFCDFAWVKSWYEASRGQTNRSPVIAVGYEASGAPLFILPLSVERRGPFRVMVWPGGTHSSYHSGLFSKRCRELVTKANGKKFWSLVFAALPRVDAFAGYGLPQFEVEAGNPLQWLPLFSSGCNAYRLELNDDWDVIYNAATNAKARSNDRRCERRLSEMGGLRFRIAVSRDERLDLLNVLIAQKSARLNEQGIPNIFEEAFIRDFYKSLVSGNDWGADRSVFLSALELGGRVIAVNLGLIQGQTFHGMVLSMDGGQLEKFGPGRMLIRRSLEHLSRNGIVEIDFGAGEDAYKANWCSEIVQRHDVLAPRTLRGFFFVMGFKTYLRTKTRIKQSPALWSFFSRYRRYLGC